MNEGDECEEEGCTGIMIPAEDYFDEDAEEGALPRLICTECGVECD